MYKVNEIFYSLQGEGRWSGRPAVFVRMSGCNLKCPFCDTDFKGYKEMSAEDILAACLEKGGDCRFIVLTGGEPTLQVDAELIHLLHQQGYYLSMETNGTHVVPEGIDWITCSPKLDFTEGGELALKKVDELKLHPVHHVLSLLHQALYLWLLLRTHLYEQMCKHLLLQVFH